MNGPAAAGARAATDRRIAGTEVPAPHRPGEAIRSTSGNVEPELQFRLSVTHRAPTVIRIRYTRDRAVM